MENLNYYYHRARNTPGDINEHIETIYEYCQGSEHITEMGVRNVVTTWAFLKAGPKKLISYDIEPCPIEPAVAIAREHNIEFEFHIADTGNPATVIEPTDVLFIDTWHVYAQLMQEFKLHADKVRRYMIIHDTETFGLIRQPGDYDCYAGPMVTDDRGLWHAVEDFLKDNSQWRLAARFHNNNGLTILERIAE